MSGFTEGLFSAFKESTALNLVSNLVSFMVNAKKDYATTMAARAQAVARIAELKALLDK